MNRKENSKLKRSKKKSKLSQSGIPEEGEIRDIDGIEYVYKGGKWLKISPPGFSGDKEDKDEEYAEYIRHLEDHEEYQPEDENK